MQHNFLRKTVGAAILGAALLTAPSAMAAGLVKNGEFNNPDGTENTTSYNFNAWKESFTVGKFTTGGGNNWAALGWVGDTVGIISQTLTVATGGVFSFTFDYLLRSTTNASLSAVLTNVATNAAYAFDFDGNNASPTTGTLTALLNLAAGDYKLSFTGSRARVDSVGLTAVPGPVAAAGLPALLALGGYMALRRRRGGSAA